MAFDPHGLDMEPLDSETRIGGVFVTAIPHTRRLFRTKTVLRLVAIVFSIVYVTSISVLDVWDTNWHWITGGPMAFGSIFWSVSDLLALFSRHRATPWNRPRPKVGEAPPSDTWGHPGLHVAAHLLISLFGLVGLMGMWVQSHMRASEAELFLHVARAIIMLIHFILFVLACIDVDTKMRSASNVIFVPDETERCRGYAPPSTLWEVVRPKKRGIGYFADHFVRFVSGENGQVQVARDYVSRPARL